MTKLVLISLLISNIAFAKITVGIVNIQKILTSVKEGKSVQNKLKKSVKAKEKKLKAFEDELKKMQEAFKKQSMVLSDKAKADKNMQFQQKAQEYMQKKQAFQTEIRKEEAELKKPILEKLKKVIDQVSQTKKVDVTFEITASPVYVNSSVDLTNDVIKAYDKKN